ncbi:MAG: hypothetical protein ACXWEI_03305 [Mycobacterium sp.]
MNKIFPQGLWGVLATPFDDGLAVASARSLPATLVPLLDQHLAAARA